jgi:hypothetical protein
LASDAKKRPAEMEHTNQQFQTDFKDMKDKVNQMYYAMLGNDLTKDGGLVGRIQKLETASDEMQKGYQKITWTHRILIAAASLITGSLGTYIISQLIHK